METQKSQEYWPTEEEFVKEPEIQKWRDLPNGVYGIQEYETITSKSGDSCILTLKTKDSEEPIVVWAPQRLKKKTFNKTL